MKYVSRYHSFLNQRLKQIVRLILSLFFIQLATLANADDKKLLIIAEEFAPYEFVRDGKVVGIDIDLSNRIFRKMGYEPEYKIMPWKRAWYYVQEGMADIILTTSRKAPREPYVWYPEEDMWQGDFVFFYKKGRFNPDQLSLNFAKKHGLKIGIIHGNSYHKQLWEHFPYRDGSREFMGDLSLNVVNPQLVPVETLKQNILKVADGRVDLTIATTTYGQYTAKLLGLSDQIDNSSTALYSKRYPLAFIKKSSHPDIEKIYRAFDSELRALKETGEYDKIIANWLQ